MALTAQVQRFKPALSPDVTSPPSPLSKKEGGLISSFVVIISTIKTNLYSL